MEQPPFAKAWLRQRQQGDAAVAAIEADELRQLTDERALQWADALLSAIASTPRVDERTAVSGLIEQQRWFSRARQR